MNIKLFLTAAVALIVGLTACNKEESLSQDGLPENAVRITASVGNPFAATRSNPVGTVEEQGEFNSGDKILVTKFNNNNRENVVYQFNGSKWAPTENKHLLWMNDKETFHAYYPVGEDGILNEEIYYDQSTLEKITMSDLMSANIYKTSKGQVLNFVMERQTMRIVIKIVKFNPEFSGDNKVSDVKILCNIQVLNPYQQGDGGVNSTYTVLSQASLVANCVSLKVGDKELRSANFLDNMNYGKSYTYNLTVGKEKLEIESVTVEDWSNGETIPGGEAEQLT